MAEKPEKKDFYRRVADKIIEKLQEGTPPWRKPYNDGGYGTLPMNPTTGKRYKGGNALYLLAQGYDDPRWMTYKQAEKMGAQIRKGEHGTPVVYWKFTEEQKLKDAEGHETTEAVSLERPKKFLSFVFNASQIDGLPPLVQERKEWNPSQMAEAILANSGAKILNHESVSAYYSPVKDEIHLPAREQFATAEDYYGTAMHELGHWTGHESRLNRDLLKNPKGSPEYAREELRAEIASFMIGEETGIFHHADRNAAYIASWIQVLENDPREIFRAASDAEKIMDFVMALQQKQEQSRVEEAAQVQDADLANTDTQAAQLSRPQERERRYLDVPYAEKDEAKELGAKWDRRKGQWYAPDAEDMAKFQKWMDPAKEVLPQEKKEQQPSRQPREYLAVPYAERFSAKKAGALWDSIAKSWYVGENADREKLAKWMPGQTEQSPAMSPREEFAEALRSLGCHVEGEHPVMDGKPHRIHAEGDKKGDRSGFYVGHLDGRPAGYIKNNRSGEETRWKSSGMPQLNDQQRAAMKVECAQRREDHAKEISAQQEKAALRVTYQLGDLQPIQELTPYLQSKGLESHKGLFTDGKTATTYIPAQDANDKIWTMQYIQEDGTKRFARQSRKDGCFHVVGGMDGLKSAKVFVISEGYATAATLSECLKMPVIAAFDAGNLVSVAKSLHERYPDKPIIIAGDDDRHLVEAQGRNPGRAKAMEAAKLVGGQAIFPKFANDEKGRAFKDWNDLGTQSTLGRSAVARQIGPVIEKALAENRTQEQSKTARHSHTHSR